MNLNPFELKENSYYAKDMYIKDENNQLKPIEDIAEKFNDKYGSYEYLLKGIDEGVDWRSIVYAGCYQGDLFCLDTKNRKYYFVNTGYGSCSGCDWYESQCCSIEGLQEIQDGLKKDIVEFDNLDEFMEWLNNEETIKYWSKSEIKEFLDDVNKEYGNLSDMSV